MNNFHKLFWCVTSATPGKNSILLCMAPDFKKSQQCLFPNFSPRFPKHAEYYTLMVSGWAICMLLYTHSQHHGPLDTMVRPHSNVNPYKKSLIIVHTDDSTSLYCIYLSWIIQEIIVFAVHFYIGNVTLFQ